jgi:hypothetical protein
VRALRAVPPRRAGFPLAALLWRASGASATWSPPEKGKPGRHEGSRRARKLAYDPDLSGPSSPQRAPSPPLYSFSAAIGWLNGLKELYFLVPGF